MTTTAIDLFAGLGGFSEGARLAGLQVVWAANHWPAAVAAHERNHPDTLHACQDLHLADWRQVPAHDVLLASPACQGHTRARGRDRPHHDVSRTTAWAVVSAVEFHRPSFLVVENVPEFRNWSLNSTWKQALGALGYTLGEHILDAADHGVPQHRRRLFVVGSKGTKHAPDLGMQHQEHQPIAPCIDWASGTWSPVERPGRSRATLERVRAGRQLHGDRFVAPYYGSGSGRTGRSIHRPIGTVVTRDRWMVVDGDRMRMLTIPEYTRAMGFGDNYHVPATPKSLGVHLLGNAVPPPLAEAVLRGLGL